MVTSAVLTRIQINELPFISEFMEYYLHILKFDRIYLIIDDAKTYKKIKKYIDKRFNNYKLLKIFTHNDSNDTLNEGLKYIVEDYILTVDNDEFLITHNLTIKQLIKKYDYDYIFFTWLMSPSKAKYRKRQMMFDKDINYHFGKNGKSFVRRNVIKKITCHYCKCKEHTRINIGKDINKPFILHFSSRGLYDTIGRMYYQRKLAKNEANNDIISNFILSKNDYIPNRILVLMYQSSIVGDINQGQLQKIFDGISLKKKTNIKYLLKQMKHIFSKLNLNINIMNSNNLENIVNDINRKIYFREYDDVFKKGDYISVINKFRNSN